MTNIMRSQVNNLMTFLPLLRVRHVLFPLRQLPLTINLLVTGRCNLDCAMCTAARLKESAQEIPTEVWCRFIARCARFQPAVFIGGGEPLMREDIFELCAAMHRAHLRFGIVTNGVLLDAPRAQRLMSFAPRIVIVSLHHEPGKGTAREQQFIAALAALRRYRGPTRLMINVVITPENYTRLPAIIEYGLGLGADMIRFEHLIFLTPQEYARHRAACAGHMPEPDSALATYISDCDCPQVGDYLAGEIPRLIARYGARVIFKPYLTPQELRAWYTPHTQKKRGCLFVQHSLFIKPDGDIIPCQFFSDYRLGNIRNDDIIEVWRSARRKNFSRCLRADLFPGCTRCCKL